MAEGNGFAPLIESHENRLSSVEDKLDKMSDRLAITEVKIDVIDQKIEQGVSQINNKLDCIFKPMQDLSNKVISLEAYKEQQINKSKWIKRTLTALLIAGGGALIELLISQLVK